MVTFTWPSITPLVADGPRHRLNQAQGPMDAENREVMAPAKLKAGDVQKDLKFLSRGLHHISCSVKRCVKNMNYAVIM